MHVDCRRAVMECMKFMEEKAELAQTIGNAPGNADEKVKHLPRSRMGFKKIQTKKLRTFAAYAAI